MVQIRMAICEILPEQRFTGKLQVNKFVPLNLGKNDLYENKPFSTMKKNHHLKPFRPIFIIIRDRI